MHEDAKAIFDEIRARPYTVSTAPGVRAENCYFKGTELIERLNALGYKTRSVIGDTYWDAQLLPKQIIGLESPDFQCTHFWCEVELDGKWVALDPSYDPPLAAHGFPVTEFGSGDLCFDILHRYTPDEEAAYMKVWQAPDYAARFFTANGPFLNALNDYFKKLRV